MSLLDHFLLFSHLPKGKQNDWVEQYLIGLGKINSLMFLKNRKYAYIMRVSVMFVAIVI